ncbi:MAG: hypothetical protein E6K39_18925 [Gammaproteobacteria bacterium]|nr:MAG: hypothetical protein E6K39_18925 [Gammaproteobacteria bacterium]
MSESLKAAIRTAVLRLLDPLVKWLLEAGMGVGDLLPLVKIAYVRAAREQGRRSSGELTRPNASRISVVTGLTRAEVANILAAADAEPTHDRGRQRAERVLSGWWNDASFQDPTGNPAVLALRGSKRSFAALVERYSGERWRVATILDELLRVKAVRRLSDGRLKAVSRTYATVRWDPDGVTAFGEHLAELCATLLHNLNSPAHRRYVRRVVNARLDPRYVPMLVRDLEEQAESFADATDDALNDPQHTITGRSALQPASLGVTLFVFETPLETETELTASKRAPKRDSHRPGAKSRGLRRLRGAAR